MSNVNSVVAIYDTHEQAEQAVKELQEAGVDMKSLSIAAKDMHTDEQVVGYYNTGDRVKFWGKLGAWWGGLAGLLFGSAMLLVPGIGHLLILGPLGSWILGGLEGAAVGGGLSAFGAGLYSLGIPKDSVVQYESAVKAGRFVVVANGGPDEVKKARATLATTQPQQLDEHRREPAAV